MGQFSASYRATGYLEAAACTGIGNLPAGAVAWVKAEASVDLGKFLKKGGRDYIKAIGKQNGWNVSIRGVDRYTKEPISGWHQVSHGAQNTYERGLYESYEEALKAGYALRDRMERRELLYDF